jgi:glucokinase
MPRCIAVDLGGTLLRVAEVNERAEIAWRASVPTANTGHPQHVLDQISELIDVHASHAVDGIAVAAPGPLDSRQGVVARIPTLKGWNDVPLRDALRTRFSLPVLVENDAIAAAVGQWRYGAGSGCDSLVYLTISTGIGGGIISDGRVVRGRRGFAGHFGHMLLDPRSSLRCACGHLGCFEAHASGSALDSQARLMSSQGSSKCQALWAQVVRDTQPAASHLALAARLGHEPSLRAWRKLGVRLAQGVVSIVHALDPERVILGGGVSQSYEWFEASLHEQLAQLLMPEFKSVTVIPAHELQDAGLLGVASLLMETIQS